MSPHTKQHAFGERQSLKALSRLHRKDSHAAQVNLTANKNAPSAAQIESHGILISYGRGNSRIFNLGGLAMPMSYAIWSAQRCIKSNTCSLLKTCCNLLYYVNKKILYVNKKIQAAIFKVEKWTNKKGI